MIFRSCIIRKTKQKWLWWWKYQTTIVTIITLSIKVGHCIWQVRLHTHHLPTIQPFINLFSRNQYLEFNCWVHFIVYQTSSLNGPSICLNHDQLSLIHSTGLLLFHFSNPTRLLILNSVHLCHPYNTSQAHSLLFFQHFSYLRSQPHIYIERRWIQLFPRTETAPHLYTVLHCTAHIKVLPTPYIYLSFILCTTPFAS